MNALHPLIQLVLPGFVESSFFCVPAALVFPHQTAHHTIFNYKNTVSVCLSVQNIGAKPGMAVAMLEPLLHPQHLPQSLAYDRMMSPQRAQAAADDYHWCFVRECGPWDVPRSQEFGREKQS